MILVSFQVATTVATASAWTWSPSHASGQRSATSRSTSWASAPRSDWTARTTAVRSVARPFHWVRKCFPPCRKTEPRRASSQWVKLLSAQDLTERFIWQEVCRVKPGSVTTPASITAAHATGTTRPSSQLASSTTGSLNRARCNRLNMDWVFVLHAASLLTYF